MKKWYAIGLLVVAMVLAASFLVACGEEEAPATTAAPTETTAAATETTAAATEETTGGVDVNTIGLYFEDMGNNVVKVTDVPAPGLQFPIHTIPDDDFAVTIEVFDASGASLGLLDTDTGEVDYSMYADTAAKIVVTTGTGDVFEYMVP
jgi:hypothetical protein